MTRGTLILVVGPSGAGKDTLIAAAARARPDLHLPRRLITRAPEGEPSRAVTLATFEALRCAGRLALHWQAHGLCYGIRAGIERRLADGQHVLANVSRSVLAAARARFAPLRVILVTAPAETLAARLAARGRESPAEIAARLDRAGYALPPGIPAQVVENAGSLDAATARFLSLLPPEPASDAA